jgi:uncharacterized membrane protein HdeD (DUF308 family)
MLLEKLTRNWWALVLRGLIAVIFGVLAIARPGATLGAFVILFGAFAILDGVFAFAAAFAGGTGTPWWALVLRGIVSLLAAAVAFLMPGITALALLYVIAFWAIFIGVMEIAIAIRLRKEISGELFLALAGLFSIAFGLFMIVRPGAGALAVTAIIGAYAIVFGIMVMVLGFRLKGLRNRLGAQPA